MQRVSAHTHNRIVLHSTCAFICLMAALARGQAPDPLLPNTFGTCSGSQNAVCDTTLNNCPSGQICDPGNQMRYISFEVPQSWAGLSTAIRVELVSLHHPTSPPPVGSPPSYSFLEGQFRYLNTIPTSLARCCNPSSNPLTCNTQVTTCSSDADCAGLGQNTKCETHLCPDSTAYGTFIRCALVGCSPEYRDWSDFSGRVTYATASTIIPSSQYAVSGLDQSCMGNEAACGAASADLLVGTERWGNTDCSNANFGIPSASDCSRVTDKAKDVAGAFTKPRVQMRVATLDPLSLVTAQDIGREVDALKGNQYPFHIRCTSACNSNFQCQPGVCIGAPNVGRCSPSKPCTTDANCTGLVGAHTCSSNGFCTNTKDACTGECQP